MLNCFIPLVIFFSYFNHSLLRVVIFELKSTLKKRIKNEKLFIAISIKIDIFDKISR